MGLSKLALPYDVDKQTLHRNGIVCLAPIKCIYRKQIIEFRRKSSCFLFSVGRKTHAQDLVPPARHLSKKKTIAHTFSVLTKR